jgi:hypothetical protein
MPVASGQTRPFPWRAVTIENQPTERRRCGRSCQIGLFRRRGPVHAPTDLFVVTRPKQTRAPIATSTLHFRERLTVRSCPSLSHLRSAAAGSLRS